jgi:seryl-tRNA synthetase
MIAGKQQTPSSRQRDLVDRNMLDLNFIRNHAQAVAENCRNRGVDADVDRVLQLDRERRELIAELDAMRRRQNEVQGLVRRETDPTARQARVDEGRDLKERVQAAEQRQRDVEQRLHDELHSIPNMTHADAPVGHGDEANRELRRWGNPPAFDFTPRDHVELGQTLDLIDLEAGARVTGSGFYFLKNEAVLLEQALVQYALRLLFDEGYTPVITPDLARDEVLDGIGFAPRGPETQVYSIEGSDLSLIATAEITLGGMLRDQILDEAQLPIRLVGLSHCFRTEAGAHGRATRGLYRVHQFTKLEMFAFTTPEQSDRVHDELLALEERIFQGLEVPYRVIDTCTGDLGGPAYRKFDLEAWMPGRQTGDDPNASRGTWGEVTSTSNCTDYQARRLGIRFRRKGRKGTQFVHTLNGTAVAISRALIALLENHQQPDGSVRIPATLVPWMPADRIAVPSAKH